MHGCVACDLAEGRVPLPGGLIHRSDYWLVEHTIGSLGLGTLIVKPERHLTAVANLTQAEAAELGPLLVQASKVVGDLVQCEQVYNCLWSHADGVPGHIHYVVQPVTADQVKGYGAFGPTLQVAIFTEKRTADSQAVEHFAEAARIRFAT